MNFSSLAQKTRSRSAVPKSAVAVVVIRKDLKMRRGKEIVQACHAVEAYYGHAASRKICVQVNSEADLDRLHQQAMAQGIPAHLIVDAGKTEFHGKPTKTVLILGSDALTKDLALY